MTLDAQPCRDGTRVMLARSTGMLPLRVTPEGLTCITLVWALHSCMYIISPRYNFDCLNQSWCSHTMKNYAVIKNDNADPNIPTWKEVQNMWSKLNKQCTKIEYAEDFAKSLI